MTDMHEIEPGLWVGAAPPNGGIPPGIDCVVNLVGGDEPAFLRPVGVFVRYLYAPIPDGPFRGLLWLDSTVDAVLRWRDEGMSVLVHCDGGGGRSAMVAVAVLMKKNGWTMEQALAAVKAVRPQADPCPDFLAGLGDYERHLNNNHDAREDQRVGRFVARFGPRLGRVLELGSCKGRHTFAVAPHAEEVVALEGRRVNLERAKYIQQTLAVRHVTFHLSDLETDPLADYGTFDCCLCVGLLYHLPKPWELLTKVAAVTDRLFLWTHYSTEKTYEAKPGLWGRQYREHGIRDPFSGLSEWSFWPTLDGLHAMLDEAGFARREVIEDDAGRSAVTLAATKEGVP